MKKIFFTLAVIICLTFLTLPLMAQVTYGVQLMQYVNDEWVDLQQAEEEFKFRFVVDEDVFFLFPETDENGLASVNLDEAVDSWGYIYLGPTYIVAPWEYFPPGMWNLNGQVFEGVLLVREE